MHIEKRKISEMLDICTCEITEFVKTCEIDAVVNAANPTLMGGSSGVDGSIHDYIDSHTSDGKKFKDIIRKEVDGENQYAEKRIRCERGKAVVTSGDSLCKYVIHVVGAIYDGKKDSQVNMCSSSCIDVLESCYYEIINQIKKYPEIKSVVIPVISAGAYGFPMELAVKIAVASVGNALIDWQNRDAELFSMSDLEKIYFCVYNPDSSAHAESACKILQKYNKYFAKNKKVVYQNSCIAQFRYLMEIYKYDHIRGYFAVARSLRMILVLLRTLFLPVMLLKDVIARYDWQRRRVVVELLVLAKVAYAAILCCGLSMGAVRFENFNCFLTCYSMADTVTYLLLLIVMADIQRPSANVIRSILLLLINYVQVSLDMANIYCLMNYGKVKLQDALYFGIIGETTERFIETSGNICLSYVNAGLKFFFMTMAFGYFSNHLRQRKFIG